MPNHVRTRRAALISLFPIFSASPSRSPRVAAEDLALEADRVDAMASLRRPEHKLYDHLEL